MFAASSARLVVHTLTGRRKVYYGWWMLAASVVAMGLASGVTLWSFGLYVGPLDDQFGWSRAEVSLGFSASTLAAGVSSPLIGRWIDRSGPRVVILTGAVLTSASLVLLSTTSTLWQWYVYLGVMAFARQMMLFMPFQALITRWFRRRHGVAVGCLGLAFSLGGFAVVPLVALAIDAFGWESSFIIGGAAVLFVFVPLSLLVIRNSPADVGEFIDGEPPSSAQAQTEAAWLASGLTLRQALRTPLFWALSGAMGLFFFGANGWIVHAIPTYESFGLSRGTAALLVSVAAAFGMLSRLSFGIFADHLRRVENGVAVLAFALFAAMATLLFNHDTIGLALFLLLWSIGSGAGPLLEPLLLSRAFGLRHFGAILGGIALLLTLAQVSAPAVAGAIFDATGSYQWALALFMSCYLGSFLLFIVAGRLPRPVFPARIEAESAGPAVPPARSEQGALP